MISQENWVFKKGMFEEPIYYHIYTFIKDITQYYIFNSFLDMTSVYFGA